MSEHAFIASANFNDRMPYKLKEMPTLAGSGFDSLAATDPGSDNPPTQRAALPAAADCRNRRREDRCSFMVWSPLRLDWSVMLYALGFFWHARSGLELSKNVAANISL
jgi:hypothetical protein